jgi:hypothetical protein
MCMSKLLTTRTDTATLSEHPSCVGPPHCVSARRCPQLVLCVATLVLVVCIVCNMTTRTDTATLPEHPLRVGAPLLMEHICHFSHSQMHVHKHPSHVNSCCVGPGSYGCHVHTMHTTKTNVAMHNTNCGQRLADLQWGAPTCDGCSGRVCSCTCI